jgi:methylmalonyl-CoA/ethylmalonyl-CoA epimerase
MHHIGVAVRDLPNSLTKWTELLGPQYSRIEELPEQGVRIAHLYFLEGPEVELVSPLGEASPIAKFLEARGEGIHHFCLNVDDIVAAMDKLRKEGLQFLSVDPQQGAEGRLIAFIHPRSLNGVLIELREVPKPTGQSQFREKPKIR